MNLSEEIKGVEKLLEEGEHKKALKSVKQLEESILYNLTRSICSKCKRNINAQILIKENKVFIRKRYTSSWVV